MIGLGSGMPGPGFGAQHAGPGVWGPAPARRHRLATGWARKPKQPRCTDSPSQTGDPREGGKDSSPVQAARREPPSSLLGACSSPCRAAAPLPIAPVGTRGNAKGQGSVLRRLWRQSAGALRSERNGTHSMTLDGVGVQSEVNRRPASHTQGREPWW